MKVFIALCIICIPLWAFETTLPSNRAKILAPEQLQLSVESQFTTEPKAKQLFGTIYTPIGLFQSVALQVKNHFKRAGFEGTAVTGAYAINPLKTLELGASLSYLSYRDYKRHHNGTMSLGVNYRLLLHPVFGEHHVGIAANNLLAVPVDGVESLLEPQSILFGWQGDLLDRRLLLSADIGGALQGNALLYDVDLRFRPSIFEVVLEKSDDFWEVLGGVRLLNLEIVGAFGKFDDREKYTKVFLTKKFGLCREEVYARRMTTGGCSGPKPGDFLMKASRAYGAQEFFRAALTSAALTRIYPDHFLGYRAYYYMARSFFYYGLQHSTQILIDSSCVADSSNKIDTEILQLELELAVAQNSQKAYCHFLTLQKYEQSDSIRDENHILMGNFFLENQKFNEAIAHFKSVDSESRLYQKSQKGYAIASYLKDHGLNFELPENDEESRKKRELHRAAYEELGLKILYLMFTPETSYTLQTLGQLHKDLDKEFLVIQQYQQLIENEKQKIYKLSHQ